MDFGKNAGDAFSYAKAGVFEQKGKWLKLILATIFLGIPLTGWFMRVYRGATPAPDVDSWGTLSLDGLKLMIIGIIYVIPIIVISLVPAVFLPNVNAGTAASSVAGTTIGLIFLSLLVVFILEIIVAILYPIASIRFARMGKFVEGFNFRAIIETIGKIGWFNYIIALILLMIVIGIPVFILEMIFLFAGLAMGHMFIALGLFVVVVVFIAPVLGTFQARYLTQVYDSREMQEAVPEFPQQ